LPNGSLKIIDRKKHIFKLSQGEYVVPEVIELIYLRSPYVAQAFVHGDALKASSNKTNIYSFVSKIFRIIRK
jgi:long-chain acyl-CoA synthetase